MPITGRVRQVAADVADLVLSRACLSCGALGRVLCPACWDALVDVHLHEASVDAGELPVTVAAEYAGVVQRLVIAHKEQQTLALGGPLGGLLAVALAAVAADLGTRRLDVVPVPPHAASLGRRGFDSVDRILAGAGRSLAASGFEVVRHPVLVRRADAGRQVGRGAVARSRAVRRTMVVQPGRRLPAAARACPWPGGQGRAAPGSGCPVAARLPDHPICAIMRGFLPSGAGVLAPPRSQRRGAVRPERATSER